MNSSPLRTCTLARRPGATQIGFVGRPFAGKGIELMAAAAGRMPECDFHSSEPVRKTSTGSKVAFRPNLHFHGYQPHAKLGAYQRRFDIAVAPYCEQVMNASDRESAAITSPLKLLEYMAAGLPVVVSDLPGVRDILAGGDVGDDRSAGRCRCFREGPAPSCPGPGLAAEARRSRPPALS